jgi:hypothetical protein
VTDRVENFTLKLFVSKIHTNEIKRVMINGPVKVCNENKSHYKDRGKA